MSAASNPLYQFRAARDIHDHPLGRKNPNLDGTHFNTRRTDVMNDTSVVSIYNGELQYKADPTLEIDFGFWEDTETMQSQTQYINMTMKRGFNVAMAKDFDVLDSRLTHAWKADQAGRLTVGGMSKNTLVLMWRTGEEAEKDEKTRLRWSEEVAKSVEEKQAEMQAQLAPLGAQVSTTLVDDDGEDEAPKKVRKQR